MDQVLNKTPTSKEVKEALHSAELTMKLMENYKLTFRELLELDVFQDIEIPEKLEY
jgi:hypothetical protein